MTRHLPGLLFLSIVAFFGGLLTIASDKDWWPLLVYLPLLALAARFLYKIGIKPVDSAFPAALFALAFVAKLISSLARYWMLTELYNNAGDAPGYHRQGQYLAQFFRAFDFSVLEQYSYRGEGTANLAKITGVVYSVLPPSLPASYLFFAVLAFSGAVLFYRAFRLAFPEVEPQLYRLLIFFLPSVLFWPSSLGKESWLFFCSGVATYGLVKFVRRGQLAGLVVAGIGLFCIFWIRPHFAAFMVIAVCLAFLLAFQHLGRRHNPVILFLGGGLMIGLSLLIVPDAQSLLEIDEFSIDAIEDSRQYIQEKTEQGGSSFKTYSILNPVGLVMGSMTVLFRPFPWEAHNPMVLITSLESLIWLGLVWTRRKIFFQRIRTIRTDPWVAFVAVYTLLMVLAFTAFGNFGILARQRTLFLPFFWMLFV